MEEKDKNVVDISTLTSEQLEALLEKKRENERKAKEEREKTYISLRDGFVKEVEINLMEVVDAVHSFSEWLQGQSAAFFEIYKEYGLVKREGQGGYTLEHNNFKFEAQQKKYKSFDERANMAAERLIEYLREWISSSADGEANPLYKLAMTLLERNRQGEFDYQSISKLYALEDKFNDNEYSAIMALFKESNVVEKMALKYYFYKKNESGKWLRVEPSFNRL